MYFLVHSWKAFSLLQISFSLVMANNLLFSFFKETRMRTWVYLFFSFCFLTILSIVFCEVVSHFIFFLEKIQGTDKLSLFWKASILFFGKNLVIRTKKDEDKSQKRGSYKIRGDSDFYRWWWSVWFSLLQNLYLSSCKSKLFFFRKRTLC